MGYLTEAGISLSLEADQLVWEDNYMTGLVSAKLAYNCQVDDWSGTRVDNLLKNLWKVGVPPKVCCFIWICFNDKILTWENLQKRGYTSPGICMLCLLDMEDVNHLFVSCTFFQRI